MSQGPLTAGVQQKSRNALGCLAHSVVQPGTLIGHTVWHGKITQSEDPGTISLAIHASISRGA
jgi:predicted short-subunit dehydrogenase-like oxidoreductase (DUF2520 family)